MPLFKFLKYCLSGSKNSDKLLLNSSNKGQLIDKRTSISFKMVIENPVFIVHNVQKVLPLASDLETGLLDLSIIEIIKKCLKI